MKHKPSSFVLAAGAALLLAACGGGGGGATTVTEPPAAATEVPASAGQSVQALVTYLGGMPAEDQREALSTDALTSMPTSESDEPMAL